MYRLLAALVAAFFMAAPARAGEVVLSLNAGMAFMGDSTLKDIGPLERDELATSWVVGASGGYQMPLAGGRIRATLGIDYLGNTDSDYGYSKGKWTIRQLADVQSLGIPLAVEYDALQASASGFYPFVGAAARLQYNKLTHQSTTITCGDKSHGCVGDDTSETGFGWHALGGVGRDFGNLNARVFYQYTDRGGVDTSPCVGGRMNLTSHEVRFRVSYAF